MMLRIRRWKSAVIGLTVALLLALLIGWPWAQHHARRKVISQLEMSNGAPVKVGRLRLGLFGIDVSDVHLLETGEDPNTWIIMDRIFLQLPLWKALGAEPVPEQILIVKPTAYLRFDRDGRILNHFAKVESLKSPGKKIEIREGKVELRQDDRDPLIAADIDLQIRPRDGQIRVAGTIGDLLGSQWKTNSDLDPKNFAARIHASTEHLVIDTAKLQKQPFLPSTSVKDWSMEGHASISFSVNYRPNRPLEYDVELDPHSLSVDVPDAGVRLERCAGKLRFTDGVLSIDNLTVDVLGGSVAANGRFELMKEPVKGECKLTITNLALKEFPDQWSVPEGVEGVFRGQADLRVSVDDEQLLVHGSGQGNINRAALFDFSMNPILASVVVPRFSYDFANGSMVTSGTLSLNIEADELPVHDVLERLAGSLDPPAINGHGVVKANLEIPLGSFDDVATYRGNVDIAIAKLSVVGARLKDASIKANYVNGVCNVVSYLADFEEGGRVSGSGTVSLQEARITAKVNGERIPLHPLVSRFVRSPLVDVKGLASTTLNISGSLKHWLNMKNWEIKGLIRSHQLNLMGERITEASTRVRLQDGMLSFGGAHGNWKGMTIDGNINLLAEKPYSFIADYNTTESPVFSLLSAFDRIHLPVGFDGQISISGEARGKLDPLTWSTSGKGLFRDAKFARLDVPKADFAWSLNPQGAELNANSVKVHGGQIDVDAEIPFAEDRASKATVTLRRINIAEAFGAVKGLPVELLGEANGVMFMTHFDKPKRMTAKGSFQGTSARMQSIELNQLKGDFHIKDRTASFHIVGDTLGGHLEFLGSAPLFEFDPAKPRVDGRLRVRDAHLSELLPNLDERLRDRLKPLRGQLTSDMHLSVTGPEFQTTGLGSLALRDVTWDRQSIASQLTAEVEWTPTRIQIRDVETSIGSGTVKGELMVNLDEQHSGAFRLRATQVNFKRLLAPWPDLARNVHGTLDVQMRGDLGATWSGTARMASSPSTIIGVPMRVTHAPMDWTFSSATGRTRIRLRSINGQLARGRVSGKATFDLGRTVNVAGRARVSELDTKALFRLSPGIANPGSGRLSGNLQIRCRNIRSAKDLRGSFTGTLQNAQALRLPVLRTVNRFLEAGKFTSNRFVSSDVKASFSNGMIQIDRLELANTGVQLLIDGNVAARGNLDLDVTAHIGQFDSQPQLRRFLRSAGWFALPTVPVTLLSEANEFLSDRLVYLHIGGTVRKPRTQLRTDRLLGQEAVQFFLKQATGTDTPP